MKLTILGGGGFRVPHVYKALLADPDHGIDDVVLYDTDVARLPIMRDLLSGIGAGPRVQITADLEEAVSGADFVFSAIRVGGLEGRISDERIALDLGVIGQETTGPGGLAYALRTVPVMIAIAERIRDLAPAAHVINFTNPAGIITEALREVLGDRVIGICDTPIGLGRRIAEAIGRSADEVELDYIGLNHLGWTRRVLVDGRDILPELLAGEVLAGFEEASLFGLDVLRRLGVIPNEYLFYYYFTRDAVEAIRGSAQTRGELLHEQQSAFFREVETADDPLALWHRTVADRSGSYMAEVGAQHGDDEHEEPQDDGYAGVAVALMRALSGGTPATMILNVANRGAIPGLPDDAVVEVPTDVSATGLLPRRAQEPSLHQLGLMSQVKQVERHIIRAATRDDADAELLAFALHPLVDSMTIAEQLVEGYRTARSAG